MKCPVCETHEAVERPILIIGAFPVRTGQECLCFSCRSWYFNMVADIEPSAA